MVAVKAIYHALDLLDRPLLAGVMQEQPLPGDTLTLLRIAAGDEQAIASTALATAKSPERVRQAAILYVQRILFAPGASHYRVLGAARDAPQEELRERLRWLMRWLHPDRTKDAWESTFAKRVVAAWDAVKTAERRRRYDATLPQEASERRARRPKIDRPARRIPWISSAPVVSKGKGGRRIGQVALGGAIVIAALLVPDWPIARPQSAAVNSDAGTIAPTVNRSALVDHAVNGP